MKKGCDPNMFSNIQFLADDQINSAINELIVKADENVIICSPWLDENSHIMDKITSNLKHKVKIEIYTRPSDGKNKSHAHALSKLRQMGAIIYFDPFLHAKMVIVDEKNLIISSSNLITTSLSRNHEAGIITGKGDIIEDALGYLTGISENLHFEQDITQVKQSRRERQDGYCIVCGKGMKYDPSHKFIRCKSCWAKQKSGKITGNHCHKCGMQSNTSIKNSLCAKCR